jgi:N-acetylmuramoyl-L-alanine amidase
MLFISRFLISVLLCAFFNSCAPKPFAASNKLYKKQVKLLAKTIRKIPKDSLMADSMKLAPYWVGTSNYGLRKPNAVIIHHTAQKNCGETLKAFTTIKSQVSAHYLICKDGTLHHMLNDYLRAWHAGFAKWGSQSDINSASIGIELDNDGKSFFTEAQLNCLLGLLAQLKKTHSIPAANFIGHADIAPARKVDPNVNFPWKRLAENGFGNWYDDTTAIELPADFNSMYALRIVGYDVSNIAAATQAFRKHFLSVDMAGELTEPEKKILYVLLKKYL